MMKAWEISFYQRFAAANISLGLLFSLYANQAWHLPEKLVVKILDVGQGDSILITTPHHKKILVDGGPASTIAEKIGDELSFFDGKIDLLILTHPNADHLEGFLEILKRYEIGAIMTPQYDSGTALFETFITKARERHIPLFISSPESDLELEKGVYLDIISPLKIASEESFIKNPNDLSLMAKLIYGHTSVLLTGDMGPQEELDLIRSDADFSIDILKSPHHGSQGSGKLPFLQQVHPQIAVISAGKNNRYQHPHLATVLAYDEQGISWRNTKDEGTITLVSDGEKWSK